MQKRHMQKRQWYTSISASESCTRDPFDPGEMKTTVRFEDQVVPDAEKTAA